MSSFNQESVLSVHHWTDTLFSFTTTRDPSFRFRNGEFTMIGLKVGEKPLLPRLQHRQRQLRGQGWSSFRSRCRTAPRPRGSSTSRRATRSSSAARPVGTLVIDNLEDGRNLYLIGTGTGHGAVPGA